MRELLAALKKEYNYYDGFWDFIFYKTKPLWKLESFYYSKKQQIERMIFWGWNMRNSWDFDAHTIYRVLQLKLERTHDCMKKNGHLVWNADHQSNLMRKLCEAKGLAKRLDNQDYYYRKNYERFSEMYKRERDGTNNLDKLFNELGFYPNAKLVSDEFYSYAFKKAYQKDNKEKEVDKKRLFYLLEKYQESWWD